MEFINNKQLSILTLTKINIPLRFSPIKSAPSLKVHRITIGRLLFLETHKQHGEWGGVLWVLNFDPLQNDSSGGLLGFCSY